MFGIGNIRFSGRSPDPETLLHRTTSIAHDACMSTTGEITGELAGRALMAYTGGMP